MTTLDLPCPERALAVGAHPDDIEFGSAATLAKWAAAGCEVHLLVLTDGAKGTWDPAADPSTLVATRQQEQRAAGARLGASDVHFVMSVDGELHVGLSEQRAVSEVIRRVRPDVVLTHDPWRRHRHHPDHEAAGRVVVASIVAARDPHFFPEQGLEPHRPRVALLFESDAVDHVERVTADDAVAKVEALLCHRSQWHSTMGIGDEAESQTATFARRIHMELRAAASRVGSARGEAYLRVEGW
jgi:LmbE family N-acetylglucosaminyl deacetylase